MSESDDDTNAAGPSTPKKKRIVRGDLVVKEKHRQQKYRADWEKEPKFSKWLTNDPQDDFKARCKVCNTSMIAEKHVLSKHSEGQKHLKNLTSIRAAKPVTSFFPSSSTSQENNTIKLAKIAEVKMAAYFAEHNIAFNSADHLGKLLKECFPDSKILKETNITRKKTAKIIYKGVGPGHKAELAEKLKTSKFSIMTDESTDISTSKASCVVVRFFNDISGRIESKFWNLHEIFSDDDPSAVNEGATAENIYKKLKKSIMDYGIPLKNVVGFGSDGCNVMMGSANSVASRFKEDCPGIIIMKCICHSAHLCASAACQKLPNRCEQLARNIFSFIHNSSKRSAALKQFQEFLDLKPQKMLHPSQTRWLSLQQVVARVLSNWDALKLYFTDMALSERSLSGQSILELLWDPYIKLYYEFLTWVLPKFTIFNKYFQSAEVVVTELDAKVKEMYKDFLFCFMDRGHVNQTDLSKINPEDKTKHLNDELLYLGISVATKINTPEIKADMNRRKEFLSRCKDFLVESTLQIKKRWDFGNEALICISLLSPKNALSQRMRERTPSILPIASNFPRVIDLQDLQTLQVLDDQWRMLPLAEIDEDLKEEKRPDVFWAKLSKWSDISESQPFKEISRFALDCLVLPHANADCERVFSKVNLTKTRIRNKLATQSIDALLLTCDAVKESKSKNCTDFAPSDDMLRRIVAKDDVPNIEELANIEVILPS